MAYKPQDLFIGVIDLFVIIVPGACLCVVMLHLVFNYPAAEVPDGRGVEAILGFGLASYLTGHLVSLVGSVAEDMRWTDTMLSAAATNTAPAARLRAWQWFAAWKQQRDRTKQYVDTLREPGKAAIRRLTTFPRELPITKWQRVAATIVRLHGGAAASHIDRKDADRRLFRNMIVVVAVACLGTWLRFCLEVGVGWPQLSANEYRWLIETSVWLVALVLFVARYDDQHLKYGRDVFEYLLAIDAVERSAQTGTGELGTQAEKDE